MTDDAKWVVVGRFGRPHGIKGFITIQSFTEPYDNILRYTDWHVLIGGKWQPLKLISVEARIKSLIAHVEGYTEREHVAQLTNLEIGIDRAQFAELNPGEYYWHQLIGMSVVNTKGELFGTVKEIIPTGSNDVLVVSGEKRYLIPYLPGQFVINIDNQQQIITVDWDMDF